MTVQIPAPLGGTGLHIKVSLSKILNPKVAPDVQMSSVRVLCELATHAGCTLAYAHCVNWIWPLRGKRQHPATLTDKRKDNETKNKTKQNIKKKTRKENWTRIWSESVCGLSVKTDGNEEDCDPLLQRQLAPPDCRSLFRVAANPRI